MWLTGHTCGPPLAPSSPVASLVRGAGATLAALSDHVGRRVSVDAAALLAERAGIAGFGRNGRISPGGSCRLLASSDGRVAVNLARPSDIDLLPAWLDIAAGSSEPWIAVEDAVAGVGGDEVVERGQLLGIPCAVVPEPGSTGTDEQLLARGQGGRPKPFLWAQIGTPRARALGAAPLVVDLSSLWAGPLCAHLLGLC